GAGDGGRGAAQACDDARGADAADEAREHPRRAARARRRGFLAAHAAGFENLRQAAAQRGVAEARLFTRWPEIAGPALSACARPLRLRPLGGLSLGGALIVAVDGARASEFEHQIPQLIEKVNAFFGYAAVSVVKTTQASDPPPPARRRRRPRPVSPEELPEAERARLTKMTERVSGGDLRAALTRLGANVIDARRRAGSDGAEDEAGAGTRGA
ncbi:MAG: DciA family protein, partial [Pseudomonadota bacterium]